MALPEGPDHVACSADLARQLDRLRVRAAAGSDKVRLSVRDIAKASGIPRSTLAGYLAGATSVPPDLLARIVLALGVSQEEASAWAEAGRRLAGRPDDVPGGAQPVSGPPAADPSRPVGSPLPMRPPGLARGDDIVGLPGVADELAHALQVIWRREEERRRVHDPLPVAVRWHQAPADLTDHWSNVCRARAGAEARPLDLTSRLDRITDTYARVPSGRLIVLGRAGSGKTVLTIRFVLELLAVRGRDAPVPVIFGLGSWDPAATSLRGWLVEELVSAHPGLARRGRHGRSLADALVNADLILPVLDGFDEIAVGLRQSAIERLNDTAMPMLVTSRTDEYAQAVARGDVLTAAAGVELERLTFEDIADYLPRTSRQAGIHGTVWDPVLTHLRHHPDGVESRTVLTALSSPLMLSMARAVYSDTAYHDPVELLDANRFPTPSAVEDHLFDAFLPSVYGPANDDTAHQRRSWEPNQAQAWLTYLAAHLHRAGTNDIAWWRLHTTIPRPVRTAVSGLLGAIAVGIAVWLMVPGRGSTVFAEPWLRVGVPAGLAAGLVAEAVKPSGPVLARAPLARFGRRLAIGLAAAGLAAIVYGLCVMISTAQYALVDPAVWALIGLALSVMALPASLVGGLAVACLPANVIREPRPARTRIRFPHRVSQFRRGARVGAAAGLGSWFVLGLTEAVGELLTGDLPTAVRYFWEMAPFGGLVTGLTFGAVAALQMPAEITTGVSPSRVLRTDRAKTIGQTLSLAVALGLVFGGIGRETRAIVAGCGVGLVVAAMWAFVSSAWCRWLVLSRLALPLTGRAPWALVAFLRDAHRRGVLRQAGPVYQFRHSSIQDHLLRNDRTVERRPADR